MSNSVRPYRRQSTRLPCPWDSPGKNTGVGCHFLLQCMKVKSESEVAQSCPTLSDPMDCSPPGSSVHGIFQERVLEWGAIAFSTSKLGIQLSTTEFSLTFLLSLSRIPFSSIEECDSGYLQSVYLFVQSLFVHKVVSELLNYTPMKTKLRKQRTLSVDGFFGLFKLQNTSSKCYIPVI